MRGTPQATLATLLALLLGFGLMQMGNTFQGTLLSIRGGIEGFSPAQIGLVGAGFWAGIVVGSLRCGKVIESVGHIRAFVALGAIASTAPLVHLLVVNPISWIAARALTGFWFAGLFIVVESWLNSSATEHTRGKILSVYGMTGLLAGIVGQLLLPTTNPSGFRPFCIITIIVAVALVPPSRGGSSVRVVRGAIRPARMSFEFVLQDSSGRTLASGSTRITDTSSPSSLAHHPRRSQALYYEKRMLERWFRSLKIP